MTKPINRFNLKWGPPYLMKDKAFEKAKSLAKGQALS
jgi:hypothetical protein